MTLSIGVAVTHAGSAAAQVSSSKVSSNESGSTPASERVEPDEGERARHFALLSNPIASAFGILNFDIGVGLSQSVSLNFMPQYLSAWNVTGYALNVGVQYFPSGDLFDGLFIYPMMGLAHATSDDDTAEANVWSLGTLAGYHWSWTVWSLRLGGGFNYFVGNVEGDIDDALDGFAPAIDISFGTAL
jgi:hypothetical protein